MDELADVRGGSGFATFCIVSGSVTMAVAGACLSVTDPPFCIALVVAGVIHLAAGVRGRRSHPLASRGSTLALFFVGVIVGLGSIALWR